MTCQGCDCPDHMTSEKPVEVQTPDGRSEAVSRCGYRDGDEAPCDKPATGLRWYRDVSGHEELIDVACEFHRNEGGDRMHAAEAERDALAAKVARVERLADEMSRRYAAANRPTRIIDAGQAADYAQGAADTWQRAEIDLRAALADSDGGDRG